MPRPTCASALWPARSSKPWPAIPTGTLPMRRRGGIISGGSASPTWRSIPTRSASPPKARCGGRSRGCCPTPCPTTPDSSRSRPCAGSRAPDPQARQPSPTSNTPPSSACARWSGGSTPISRPIAATHAGGRRGAPASTRSSPAAPGSPRSTGCSTGCPPTRLSANKDELLRVLDHPEVPLHTNGSERDLRSHVIKRKISGGTRSNPGRDCRDAFLGLLLTCAKLGVSFWDFLGHRLGVAQADAPDLPDLVRLRSATPPECPDFCPRYFSRD